MSEIDEVMSIIKEASFYTVEDKPWGHAIHIKFNEDKIRAALEKLSRNTQ